MAAIIEEITHETKRMNAQIILRWPMKAVPQPQLRIGRGHRK
jgi:hypothetical protein